MPGQAGDQERLQGPGRVPGQKVGLRSAPDPQGSRRRRRPGLQGQVPGREGSAEQPRVPENHHQHGHEAVPLPPEKGSLGRIHRTGMRMPQAYVRVQHHAQQRRPQHPRLPCVLADRESLLRDVQQGQPRDPVPLQERGEAGQVQLLQVGPARTDLGLQKQAVEVPPLHPLAEKLEGQGRQGQRDHQVRLHRLRREVGRREVRPMLRRDGRQRQQRVQVPDRRQGGARLLHLPGGECEVDVAVLAAAGDRHRTPDGAPILLHHPQLPRRRQALQGTLPALQLLAGGPPEGAPVLLRSDRQGARQPATRRGGGSKTPTPERTHPGHQPAG